MNFFICFNCIYFLDSSDLKRKKIKKREKNVTLVKVETHHSVHRAQIPIDLVDVGAKKIKKEQISQENVPYFAQNTMNDDESIENENNYNNNDDSIVSSSGIIERENISNGFEHSLSNADLLASTPGASNGGKDIFASSDDGNDNLDPKKEADDDIKQFIGSKKLQSLGVISRFFFIDDEASDNNIIKANCKLCKPGSKESFVSGSRKATSNFVRHMKVLFQI